eukprot:g82767.t1
MRVVAKGVFIKIRHDKKTVSTTLFLRLRNRKKANHNPNYFDYISADTTVCFKHAHDRYETKTTGQHTRKFTEKRVPDHCEGDWRPKRLGFLIL